MFYNPLMRDDGEHKGRFIEKRLSFFEKEVFEYLKNNHCPYIPEVIDYKEEGGFLIVKEEFIVGETLTSYIKRNSVSREERLNIIDEVCKGLEFLHNAPTPIIHRDIKPDNIMVDKFGITRILDYDAAKTYKEGRSRDTVLIGTEGNAAPEQYGFGQSDPRTDVYGVGKLIIWLFPGDPELTKVAQKANMIDPDKRYQTIAELRSALPHRTKEGTGRYRSTVIICLICLAVSVLIIALAGVSSVSRKLDIPALTIATADSSGGEVQQNEIQDNIGTENSVFYSNGPVISENNETDIPITSLSDDSYDPIDSSVSELFTEPGSEPDMPPEQPSGSANNVADNSEILSTATLSPTPLPTTSSSVSRVTPTPGTRITPTPPPRNTPTTAPRISPTTTPVPASNVVPSNTPAATATPRPTSTSTPTPTLTPTPVPTTSTSVSQTTRSSGSNLQHWVDVLQSMDTLYVFHSYSYLYQYLLDQGATPDEAAEAATFIYSRNPEYTYGRTRLIHTPGLSRPEVLQLLTDEGYTQTQIDYAMENYHYFINSAEIRYREIYESNSELTDEEIRQMLYDQGFTEADVRQAHANLYAQGLFD